MLTLTLALASAETLASAIAAGVTAVGMKKTACQSKATVQRPNVSPRHSLQLQQLLQLQATVAAAAPAQESNYWTLITPHSR